MDTKFSMYVISNGSFEYYPENTLSKFSVKLPLSLNLPISFNEKWGIALNGIGVSSKFTSDYTDNEKMPILIELLSYADQYSCQEYSGIRPSENPCHLEKSKYNAMIQNISGYCHSDESDTKDCSTDLNLINQLDDWILNNIRSGGLIEHYIEGIDSKDMKSVVYNFYFNSLKNQKSLDKFVKTLRDHELLINIKNPNNISLSNKPSRNVERIFMFRKDFFDKSVITQNIKPFQETNEIIIDESILFSNNMQGRNLNRTSITMNNVTYIILILNEEHTLINIDFKGFTENYLSIPNIIKIKCENIRAQIFNNSHSKDIEIIKPRFKNFEDHYFHEFENPIFVRLLNTSLRDLTFELTDEYDNQLSLTEGIPTLLQLSFKRMISTSKSFSVRLTPIITEEENSASKFSNILPNILDLNENWRVGLKEITFPSNIKTFPNDNNEVWITEYDSNMKEIPDKNYYFKLSNDTFNNDLFVKSLNTITSAIDLTTFSIVENVLFVTAKRNCRVLFSENIAKILQLPRIGSLQSTISYYGGDCPQNKLIQMGQKINWIIFRPAYLMIYSDLVKQTLISSEYTNILRIVPVKYEDEQNEYQSTEFRNIEFKEIANKFVNIINIEIRSHSGELVQFDSNFVSLHLYFTNNPFNKDI